MQKSTERQGSVLWQRRQEGILIAAHRGTCGGNIVPNTIAAFENALRHKADVVEMDCAMTTDGVFYAMHDGLEMVTMGTTRNIRTMHSAEVDGMFLRNSNLEAVNEKPCRLDDALEHLKGRCLINLDRTWFYWQEIIRVVKRHGMADQIILKSPPETQHLQVLAELAPELMYLPILQQPEQAERLAGFDVNWVAAELLFEREDSPLVEDGFLQSLKARNLLLWANVITLNDYAILCAGKDDNHSILYGPDDYWGWCVRKGFDILQTDWPLLLRDYLASINETTHKSGG